MGPSASSLCTLQLRLPAETNVQSETDTISRVKGEGGAESGVDGEREWE